jgi:hypothetical protein
MVTYRSMFMFAINLMQYGMLAFKVSKLLRGQIDLTSRFSKIKTFIFIVIPALLFIFNKIKTLLSIL